MATEVAMRIAKKDNWKSWMQNTPGRETYLGSGLQRIPCILLHECFDGLFRIGGSSEELFSELAIVQNILQLLRVAIDLGTHL